MQNQQGIGDVVLQLMGAKADELHQLDSYFAQLYNVDSRYSQGLSKKIRARFARFFSSKESLLKMLKEQPKSVEFLLSTLTQNTLNTELGGQFKTLFNKYKKVALKKNRQLDALYYEWHDNGNKHAMKVLEDYTVIEYTIQHKAHLFVMNNTTNQFKTESDDALNADQESLINKFFNSFNSNQDSIKFYLDVKQ